MDYLKKLDQDDEILESVLVQYEKLVGIKMELREGGVLRLLFNGFDSNIEETAKLELRIDESVPKYSRNIQDMEGSKWEEIAGIGGNSIELLSDDQEYREVFEGFESESRFWGFFEFCET